MIVGNLNEDLIIGSEILKIYLGKISYPDKQCYLKINYQEIVLPFVSKQNNKKEQSPRVSTRSPREDTLKTIDDFINREFITLLTPEHEQSPPRSSINKLAMLDTIIQEMKSQPPPMHKILTRVSNWYPPVSTGLQTDEREQLKKKAALKRREQAKIHGDIPMPLYNRTSKRDERN